LKSGKPRAFAARRSLMPANSLVLATGERAEIVGLVVDAATRRRGTGTLLVEAAQQWVRAAGLAQIIVRSNAACDASHVFYRALGFKRVKTQHVYARSLAGSVVATIRR
jgi:GNAT superfamily N-acetyltransferase